MKLLLVVFLVHLFLGLGASQSFRPEPDSGCGIMDYGCYSSGCPTNKQRDYLNKCSRMFDFDLLPPFDQQPEIVRGATGGNPYLQPIKTTCKQDKYCEIEIKPLGSWGIIDWCITTTGEMFHLQLLGPPHTPVCCDDKCDKKYTMMCMRRDFALKRFIDRDLPENKLLISLYLKLLPRAVINLRLSLMLLDKTAYKPTPLYGSDGKFPDDFKKSVSPIPPSITPDKVKPIIVEDLKLDLSKVTKWEELGGYGGYDGTKVPNPCA